MQIGNTEGEIRELIDSLETDDEIKRMKDFIDNKIIERNNYSLLKKISKKDFEKLDQLYTELKIDGFTFTIKNLKCYVNATVYLDDSGSFDELDFNIENFEVNDKDYLGTSLTEISKKLKEEKQIESLKDISIIQNKIKLFKDNIKQISKKHSLKEENIYKFLKCYNEGIPF